MKKGQPSKTVKPKKAVIDSKEDIEMQKYLRARANYSLAILGEAFVRNGSGSFLNIRCVETPLRILKKT